MLAQWHWKTRKTLEFTKNTGKHDENSKKTRKTLESSTKTGRKFHRKTRSENTRKCSELEWEACSFIHPPNSLEKACFSLGPQHDSQKNINITREVSSVVFVLQHVSRNIAILVPELPISAGRTSKTLKFAKPIFHETFNGTRYRCTSRDKSCYSYSNGSTFIVEKHCFR